MLQSAFATPAAVVGRERARPILTPMRPASRNSRAARVPRPAVMSSATFDPTLYFIADAGAAAKVGAPLPEITAAAVKGGARVVQYRDKTDATRAERVSNVRALIDAAGEGVVVVVNDAPGIAAEAGAKAVHVGQDDCSVAEARAAFGDGGADVIVGVSVGTRAEAEQAVADGADYVGVGCVYETESKADAGKPIGLGGVMAVVDAVGGRVPVVGIGGVNGGNIGGLAVVGCAGAAVIGSLMRVGVGGAALAAEILRERFECSMPDQAIALPAMERAATKSLAAGGGVGIKLPGEK
jgi:thiamine-phosphate pyrophosphorylase